MGEGLFQEGGEAGADAGGVDDDVAGVPEFGEGFELGVEVGVASAGPEPRPEGRRICGGGRGSEGPG